MTGKFINSSYVFISYSRSDKAYVNKLIQAFESRSMPVWFDEKIQYSSEWRNELEKYVKNCYVFVLVMTPRAYTSKWVQDELKAAISLKKPIYPILLEGEMWSEVDDIQASEVSSSVLLRKKCLPPSDFFEQIAAKLASLRIEENFLASEKGIDYSLLRDLLIEQKWEDADHLTYEMMLAAVDRNPNDWFTTDDYLRDLPCTDLLTMDRLWLHYSRNWFGFSVQKKLYLQAHLCKGNGEPFQIEEDYDVSSIFYNLVGWDNLAPLDERPQDYINFSLSAKKGHLPFFWGYQCRYIAPLLGGGFSAGIALLSRVESCQLVHGDNSVRRSSHDSQDKAAAQRRQEPVKAEWQKQQAEALSQRRREETERQKRAAAENQPKPPLRVSQPRPSQSLDTQPSITSQTIRTNWTRQKFLRIAIPAGIGVMSVSTVGVLSRRETPLPDEPVDYLTLESLLQAGDWRSADQETERLMLQIANREESGWLTRVSLEKFPCEELQRLDDLWVKYSFGKFGLLVQAKIWQEEGSPTEYNEQWESFGNRVGWRKNGSWLNWASLIADPENSPAGEFPSTGAGGSEKWVGPAAVFLSRVATCKL